MERLILLFRLDFIGRWKSMAMLCVVMYASYVVLDLLRYYGVARPLVLFLFGSLAAAWMFPENGSADSRLRYLMLPAEAGAKFFERWLVAVPGFLVAYCLVTVLELLTYTWLCRLHFTPGPVLDGGGFTHVAPVPGVEVPLYGLSGAIFTPEVLTFFLLVQSCYVLGSTLWHRSVYLRTTIAIGAIVSLYIITVGLIWHWSGVENLALEFLPVGVYYSLAWGFILFNWLTAFVRFCESDIR